MNYLGMDATTGKLLGDLAHIRQSVRDILTTRIGTRTMRRTYGSIVPELIDQPANPQTQIRLRAATVMAITKWEPRIRITKISFALDMQGRAVLDMDGVRLDGSKSGTPFSFSFRATK